MKKYAVIVAGGKGERMNAGIPKQFIMLGDQPLLMHTLRRFQESDKLIEIIVVLPASQMAEWKKLCASYSFNIVHHRVEGGETRFQSVRNGLQLVNEQSIVAVHDGVRPFASTTLINRCFSEAEKNGNAVPFVSVNESIREVDGYNSKTADRSSFVLIQTPQCFDSESLKQAYAARYNAGFTDDASVVEAAGHGIHLVEGERENIKITFPIDLAVGEALLKNEKS